MSMLIVVFQYISLWILRYSFLEDLDRMCLLNFLKFSMWRSDNIDFIKYFYILFIFPFMGKDFISNVTNGEIYGSHVFSFIKNKNLNINKSNLIKIVKKNVSTKFKNNENRY